jgi:hypothetical protein
VLVTELGHAEPLTFVLRISEYCNQAAEHPDQLPQVCP